MKHPSKEVNLPNVGRWRRNDVPVGDRQWSFGRRVGPLLLVVYEPGRMGPYLFTPCWQFAVLSNGSDIRNVHAADEYVVLAKGLAGNLKAAQRGCVEQARKGLMSIKNRMPGTEKIVRDSTIDALLRDLVGKDASPVQVGGPRIVVA